MNKKNGFQQDLAEELAGAAGDLLQTPDIQNAIAPTTRRMVLQYHALLRQELEQELARVIQEFETAAAEIEDTIAKRVEASLAQIQQEVYRVFKDSLSNVEVSLADPILPGKASRKPRPGSKQTSGSEEELNEAQPDPEMKGDGHNGWHDATPTPAEVLDGQGLEQTVANANGAAALPDDPDDEVYEGMVRLSVEANQSSRQVVQFVRELRQKPQFRLLRMAGSHKEGVDIWVGLREPLCLKKILPQIQVVSQVSDPPGGSPQGEERSLSIRLTEDTSLPSSIHPLERGDEGELAEAQPLDTVEPVLA